MARWTDEWIAIRTDGQMDGLTDRHTFKYTIKVDYSRHIIAHKIYTSIRSYVTVTNY